jgi:hypothetical protein
MPSWQLLTRSFPRVGCVSNRWDPCDLRVGNHGRDAGVDTSARRARCASGERALDAFLFPPFFQATSSSRRSSSGPRFKKQNSLLPKPIV